MSRRPLDVGRLIALIDELIERLAANEVDQRLTIVGGAAIALRFDSERMATRDIDVINPLGVETRRIVQAIAAEHNDLDDDWLSDL